MLRTPPNVFFATCEVPGVFKSVNKLICHPALGPHGVLLPVCMPLAMDMMLDESGCCICNYVVLGCFRLTTCLKKLDTCISTRQAMTSWRLCQGMASLTKTKCHKCMPLVMDECPVLFDTVVTDSNIWYAGALVTGASTHKATFVGRNRSSLSHQC